MEEHQKNSRSGIKRGDIFYANLSPVIGSEQGGSRPVLILQNNIGNKYSPTIIVAAITAQITKGKLPTHVELKANKCKLERDSVVLLEQLRTIDKKRLGNKITTLDKHIMKSVDEAIKLSVGLLQL
ncbi:type II toxin-antitoxin system PemK/MazF family toxin [Pectinatus frisingensis]|jgi:mRNA interferase MazF|uniref:type II toxin-antitoxin system PemK/MazF family toxin n=1 Tax=Pectinatus frisingensis TaxID=865 RepID=UPI0015F4004B|nr:type II toxin-antitoxin system PemK/MazF family toxin [Pectinatus frisingensis]